MTSSSNRVVLSQDIDALAALPLAPLTHPSYGAITLAPYQRTTVARMRAILSFYHTDLACPAVRPSVQLTAQTGTGKTVMSLATAIEFGGRRLCIVAPPILAPQWRRTVEAMLPGAVFVRLAPKEHRKLACDLREAAGVSVLFISQDTLTQKPHEFRVLCDALWSEELRPDCLIVDESSFLHATDTNQVLNMSVHLQPATTAICIFATATPLTNYGEAEARNLLFNALSRPACLEGLSTPDRIRLFHALSPGVDLSGMRYALGPCDDVDVLRPMLIYAVKVGINAAHQIAIDTEPDRSRQRRHLAAFGFREGCETLVLTEKLKALEAIVKHVTRKEGWETVPKVDHPRVYVGCGKPGVLLLLQLHFQGLGYRCARLDGTVNPEERRLVCEDFDEGSLDVLFVNPDVGGQGLDFKHGCNVCVFFGCFFNLAKLHQFAARGYRSPFRETMLVLMLFSASPSEYRREHLLEFKEVSKREVYGDLVVFELKVEEMAVAAVDDVLKVVAHRETAFVSGLPGILACPKMHPSCVGIELTPCEALMQA